MIVRIAKVLGALLERLRTPSGASDAAPHWINVAGLREALTRQKPPVVIDVRNPDEFTGPLGHIAGARNLPMGDLQRRVPELADLKSAPIVLVCYTDKRSATAASQLSAAGFCDVVVLRGGMKAWTTSAGG